MEGERQKESKQKKKRIKKWNKNTNNKFLEVDVNQISVDSILINIGKKQIRLSKWVKKGN